MRTKKRSVLLRAPGLVVLLTLLLATTGLVYAHWTATLDLNGNVRTGSVVMAWTQAWTNDDGVLNDGDGEPTSTEIYDAGWGTSSSADPSDPWDLSNPEDGNRYTKDVAKCTAGHNSGTVTWNIRNSYPSYYCTLTAKLKNTGSVPVRATSIAFTATKTPEGGSTSNIGVYAGANEGNFYLGGDQQIEGDISAGVRCGTQIDPKEIVTTSGWLHVMEAASQNATYAFTLSQNFVNWNEWDVGMCTPGAVVANADGSVPTPRVYACPVAWDDDGTPDGTVEDYLNDCAIPTP